MCFKYHKPKGYLTNFGYMGFINGAYYLFATEEEYIQEWRIILNEQEERTALSESKELSGDCDLRCL